MSVTSVTDCARIDKLSSGPNRTTAAPIDIAMMWIGIKSNSPERMSTHRIFDQWQSKSKQVAYRRFNPRRARFSIR